MNNDLENLSLRNNKFEKEGRTVISMGQGGSIEVPPDSNDKELYTWGVNGCTVTAIFSEYEDGKRRGVLTHYDPTEILQNSQVLQKELVSENAKRSQAKIFVRGDYIKAGDTWKMIPDKDTEIELGLLESNLKSKFGENITIEIMPYLMDMRKGEDRSVYFTIKPKQENEDVPAEITWWGETTKFEKSK